MGKMMKRDWEIVRIFLILALLTLGFVWGIQSLILTPTTTVHIQGYSQSESVQANTGSRTGEAVLSEEDIFPNALSPFLSKPLIPLHSPVSPSMNKKKP